jgi:hypothetical protein
MEQPTIFYALVFYLHLSGQGDTLNGQLAWAYVGLRVIHSLVQGTINRVTLRFIIFTLSSLILCAMCARAVLALIG